jgi:hypothetical protein
MAGPDLPTTDTSFSRCVSTDALIYGTKVGRSWAYAGQALAPRGFGCFPDTDWASGSGVHVEDFDVPADAGTPVVSRAGAASRRSPQIPPR